MALRRKVRTLGYARGVAVPHGHRVETPIGRLSTDQVLAKLANNAWQRIRTGCGAKGKRRYDWALIETLADDTPT